MLSIRKIFSLLLIIGLMSINTFARTLNDWKNVQSLVRGLKVNVTLKDGRVIKGKLAETKTDRITLSIDKQKTEFKKDEVAKVTKIDPMAKFFQSITMAGVSTVGVITGAVAGVGVGIEQGSKEDLLSIAKGAASGVENGVAAASISGRKEAMQIVELGEVIVYIE
jgi:hypothetical protein